MPELPDQWEVAPEPGWIEPALAEEFPGLSLVSTVIEASGGRSPEPLREQLRLLSDRIGGPQAIQLRQQPIPWAYRVFFRHIGLDPDTTRTPIEQLIFERIHDGSFKSRNRVDDALTIAMVEVGRGAASLRRGSGRGPGRPAPLGRGRGVRGARLAACPTGRSSSPTSSGRSESSSTAPPRALRPEEGTSRVLLVAIGVRGVPDIALEEALWVAGSALRA